MNKTSPVFDVSEAICDDFKLFKGKRTQAEDEQIFLKVLSHCLKKLMSLIENKLSAKEKEFFSREIYEIKKISKPQEQIEKLQNLFSKMAGRARLDPQEIRNELRQTIDNVLQKAISNRLKK